MVRLRCSVEDLADPESISEGTIKNILARKHPTTFDKVASLRARLLAKGVTADELRRIGIDAAAVPESTVSGIGGAFGALVAASLLPPHVSPGQERGGVELTKATVAAELQAIGNKYMRDQYVERPIDGITDSFLKSDARLLLVVDGAGSGKTSLCCRVADRVGAERPTAFVSCGHVSDVIEEIARQLNEPKEIKSGGCEEKPLIIIDGINEFDRPHEMRSVLARLLKQLPGSVSQCLMTCRDISWPYYDPRGDTETLRHLLFQGEVHSTGSFSSDALNTLIDTYLDHFKVKAELQGHARASMGHPLLLRFFCEAYADMSLGRVNDVYMKDLFDTYLERKRVEIVRRLLLTAPQAVDEFLEAVAHVFWDVDGAPDLDKFARVPHGGLNPVHGSIYAALLDTGILTERDDSTVSRRITFRYEAFQDYVTARMLHRSAVRASGGGSALFKACLGCLVNASAKPTLETVAGFLLAMSRDPTDQEAAGWRMVCRHGSVYCRATVHALRQVAAERLLSEEFRLLVGLAGDSDPDTLRLAMDCVADRYAYLPREMRTKVTPWIASGYPGVAARLIVENFGRFEETGWTAIGSLVVRDRSEISRGLLMAFAEDRIRQGDRSPELRALLKVLADSADLQIGREASARLASLT